MSIAEVKNKLVTDTEEKVSRINNDSERKILEIKKDLQAEKKKLEETSLTEIARKLEVKKRKHHSSLSRETKLRTEKAKREIIEDILSSSLLELKGIDDEKLKNFVEKILKEIPKNIKGEVLVPNGKINFFKHLLSSHPSLSIEESKTIEGGFKVSGIDYLYDFTFTNLLQLKKSDLELKLSRILFS